MITRGRLFGLYQPGLIEAGLGFCGSCHRKGPGSSTTVAKVMMFIHARSVSVFSGGA